MKIEYGVITGMGEKFAERVRDRLDEGWKLQGGVSVATDFDGNETLAQALYREIHDDQPV